MGKYRVLPKGAPRQFLDGQRVWDELKNKIGTVMDWVGGEQRRYYVKHSGYVWSVPEKYLDSAHNKIK